MCRLCEAYGKGQYWYFSPHNYARQLYGVKKPGEQPKDYTQNPEYQLNLSSRAAIEAKMDDPEKYPELLRIANEHLKNYYAEQVVTLEEAKRITDIASPLAKMSCTCRIHARAQEETNPDDYSCLGLGIGMFKWERWPDRYRGGIEFISPDEAKKWVEYWDKRGFPHVVMTFGGSYIGGLCNCDASVCGEIFLRLDYGQVYRLTKGHHVAKVDYDVCNGCGVCVQRCQFGALRMEPRSQKVNIDQFKCFGCGLCHTGCPRDAISLVERISLPALCDVW
jgi:Pyruvate/2-oxoacid:ferredoxin oxidoreductase delta subunit